MPDTITSTPKGLRRLTLGQILDETVARFAEREAVIYVDRDFRLTWRQFGDLVDRLARGLMALGIGRGEKVAVWATNIPYWVALQFATAKIGAVLLTVNTNYRRNELDYLLRQSETENLFIIDGYQDIDYLSVVYELLPELRLQQRGYLESERYPPPQARLFPRPGEASRHVFHPRAAVHGRHDRRRRIRPTPGGPGLRRRGQYAVHLGHHRISQRGDAHPLQHRQQRLLDRREPAVQRKTIASVCPCRCFTVSAVCWGCWPPSVTAPAW